MISLEGGYDDKSLSLERLIEELPHLLHSFPPEKISHIEEFWTHEKDDPTIDKTGAPGIKDLHELNKFSLKSLLAGDVMLKEMLEISKTRARELGIEC